MDCMQHCVCHVDVSISMKKQQWPHKEPQGQSRTQIHVCAHPVHHHADRADMPPSHIDTVYENVSLGIKNKLDQMNKPQRQS